MTEQPDQGKITTPFEPARHLTRVGGSDYLEVKWRLVWMRDQHPDAMVRTELLSHSDNTAVFRAIVEIPGGGCAYGHGSESAGDFRDYLEKAETKAIGRALAALGFGTQFCPDHEFGASVGRVVDSPVNRRNPQQGTPRPTAARPSGSNSSAQSRADPVERDIGKTASVAASGPDQPATQRQLRYLQAVAREAGIDGAGLDDRSEQEFGVPAAALNRRDASAMIDIISSQK
jgi:hypothetical protein